MPELPEVETVRRTLLPRLVGRKIERILVRDRRLRFPVDVKRLQRHLRQQKISTLKRRGKYLQFQVESGDYLIIHLGMSGRLFLQQTRVPYGKHDHIAFMLDNGRQLRFRDPRRFGIVEVVAANEIDSYKRFHHLGMEPLSRRCDANYLYTLSRGLKKPIKNFLMDAAKIVGIGNIYANEALFAAAIHPQKPAGKLSRQSWQRLTTAIKKVLRRAIQKGGTTINDFHDGNGNSGYFQLSLSVYGREGEPCSRCARPIRVQRLGGRSTFYCSHCQRR